jgi:hypothetical protein
MLFHFLIPGEVPICSRCALANVFQLVLSVAIMVFVVRGTVYLECYRDAAARGMGRGVFLWRRGPSLQ